MIRTFSVMLMVWMFFLSVVCLSVKQTFLTQTDEPQSSYIGAVVEYQPRPILFRDYRRDPFKYISSNVLEYRRFVKEVKERSRADIVVFPELGLTSTLLYRFSRRELEGIAQILPETIPDRDVLCDIEDIDDNRKILRDLCSISREFEIYTVANVVTMEPCDSDDDDECPDNGFHFYNTNVAFDRQGRIISRYRKFNLYGEQLMSKTKTPDVAVFDTDFGVRFGMFICFDINYDEPAKSLERLGIQNVAFSSAWYDGFPFLTAVGYHSGWAMSRRINLLASGYHNPVVGTLGSGLYSGYHGIVNYTFYPDSGSVSLASRMEYTNRIENTDNGIGQFNRPFIQENMTQYTFQVIDSNKNFLQHSMEGLRCTLEYELVHNNDDDDDQMTNNGFVLASRFGPRTIGIYYTVGIQVCGVIYCHDVHRRETCGVPIRHPDDLRHKFEFRKLKLTGDFSHDVRPMPITMTVFYQPILPSESVRYQRKGNSKFSLTAQNPINHLYTFALYGRDYTLDK